MKNLFLLSFAALSSAAAVAQNSAVINQQGSSHEVSVVQQGAGNTSVVNQLTSQAPNRVSVTQSGSGNVATINQGNDTTTGPTNSVNTTQSGEGETIINQTKDGNSINVYQSGGPATDPKKKGTKKKVKE